MAAPTDPKPNGLAREAVLIAAGLALAAAGAEAYLRAFAPQELMTPAYISRYGRLAFEPGATIRNRARSRYYDVVYRLNSLGFRGPERALAAPPGVRRAVVLGPSIAFGQGVEDRETYSSRLEEALSVPGSPTFQVINMGWGGMPVTLYPAVYARLAAPFSPDYLIVQFQASQLAGIGADDAAAAASETVSTTPHGWQALRLRLRKNRLYTWLCENSNLWALRRSEMAAHLRPSPAESSAAPQDDAELQRLAVASLDSLFSRFCAPGRRALVLYDPADVARYPTLAEYLGRAERCRRSLAVPIDPARDVFGADDPHWTPATHARVAARLAEAVQNWK